MRREPREFLTTAAAARPAPVVADDHRSPAYHEARLCYRQGRIETALQELDGIFRATSHRSKSDLREPALLQAWCLIEQKNPAAALDWLATAGRRGYLAADDPGAQIIALNARLYGEDLDAIGVPELEEYFRVHYRAGNATVAVAGAVDAVNGQF